MPGQRQPAADRARLRPRPRDVAVRRPGRRAPGAHPPADPRLLLPGHDARARATGHDPGADHRRHRQRRPGAARPAACGSARWAAARRTPCRRPPASTTWRLRHGRRQHGLDYDNGGWHAYKPGGKPLAGDAEFFRAGIAHPARRRARPATYRGALRLSEQEHGQRAAAWTTTSRASSRARCRPRGSPPPCARRPSPRGRTPPSTAPRTRPATTTPATPPPARSTAASVTRTPAATPPSSRPPGKVLNYGGKPAFTQFGSSSGGWLSAGSQPYLVAKADPYDGFSGNPMHTWTTTVTQGGDPERLSLARHAEAGAGHPARRPRRLVRPGRADEARRRQGRRDPDRRRLPLEVRAALELVPLRLGERRSPRRRPDRPPRRPRRRPRRRSPCVAGDRRRDSVLGSATPAEYSVAGRSRPRASSTAGCSTTVGAGRARALRPGAQGLPHARSVRPRSSASPGPAPSPTPRASTRASSRACSSSTGPVG